MVKYLTEEEEDKAIIQLADKEFKRRSSYPRDMGFYPLTDKFAEGAEIKLPWLPDYWNHRLLNKQATTDELFYYLDKHGVDATNTANRFRGSLLGLALGDAVGVPQEFQLRDKFTVTDIIGGGVFNLDRGDWTDDTSMACCLAYSLIKCNGFNADHLMKCFCYWYKYGAYSPTGTCFDIGNTIQQALDKYLATGNPYSGSSDSQSAGNGSLMRLAPVVLFYFNDFEKAVHFAAESSKTTHQAVEAVDACRYFAALLYGAIIGVAKEQLLTGLYSPIEDYWSRHPLCKNIQNIALGSYKIKSRDEISSSGYVVHTLEAALWAFFRNSNFKSGLLEAVNLAGDADTIGAIYGQLAGAYYGETALPIDWILKLHAAQGFYHFAQGLMMKTGWPFEPDVKRRPSRVG